ncbi:MAG TPA: heparan-alpha-glucosaminide N-acetyltransferase domain-containing protein [Chitinophagaceae bacterium]|nr:heparan-alpha-glucosaminide N-acetyltransferase domain-containing protein [Chitinophagaceae bacterium]
MNQPAYPTAQTLLPPKTGYRIDAIDLLRGLIMIIMALDHTRDFFHRDAWTQDPLNLETTTPILFFTRWITHFCAPVFVFLAGTSAWFQGKRKTKKELSLFLIKRGLWLIVAELTIMSFSFTFDPTFGLVALQTIWSIGMSMVVLGGAVWLPFNAILALGFLIVLGHNTLDLYEANKQTFSIVYSLLHRPGFFPIVPGHNLLITYPFLPWCGLMLLGYGFGKLFTSYEGAPRRKIITLLGLSLIAFFILLRATNIYGNGAPWSVQKNALYTLLSFINTRKYPPSLLYMCMTLGPALLLLAWIGPAKNKLAQAITVYGRVPFFYYVVHFYLIHAISALLSFTRGHTFADGIFKGLGFLPNFIYANEGYSLSFVYGMWAFIVLAMYPLCRWFSQYKKTHTQWWVSYL